MAPEKNRAFRRFRSRRNRPSRWPTPAAIVRRRWPALAATARRRWPALAATAQRRWPALAATWRHTRHHHLHALAAASAYYALLSIFPALTALVSLYGLIANPARAGREIAFITAVLPPTAADFIAAWIETIVHTPRAQFGFGFVFSLLFGLWTLWSATAMLMTAINICYGTDERRSALRFDLSALALSVGFALLGAAALAVVALLPVLFHLLPGHGLRHLAFSLIRWPLLAALALSALTLLYRFAATREQRRWEWFGAGTLTATALWLGGSILFTLYVSRFGAYDQTYGTLGAVIVLLLWFYMSAYAALIGAEINAEAGRRRAQVTEQSAPSDQAGEARNP